MRPTPWSTWELGCEKPWAKLPEGQLKDTAGHLGRTLLARGGSRTSPRC